MKFTHRNHIWLFHLMLAARAGNAKADSKPKGHRPQFSLEENQREQRTQGAACSRLDNAVSKAAVPDCRELSLGHFHFHFLSIGVFYFRIRMSGDLLRVDSPC